MSEIIKKLYRDGVYDDIEISGYRTVSKEEIEFREKLKQMLPLNYEYQKCIKVENKRKYVDIFISDKKTIIEYDGRHHFLPVYGKKRFEETQYDDKKLNEHCKKKNINLIRVNSFDYRKNKNKILSDIAGKILC
jgi:very-short-patch-repair endonuclease